MKNTLAAIVIYTLTSAAFAADPTTKVWNYDDTAVGKLPAGFKSESGKWAVARDGENRVAAQSAKSDDKVFNVLLATGTTARDVDLSGFMAEGCLRSGRRDGA
ncbi:MAG TPA: hypothetical protein VFI31_21650 [Pirellulales bacterium]|nr:hypothetical protein [Pirellulales bacterium]